MKIGCVFKFCSALSIGNLLSTVQDKKVTNDADLCKAVHTALGGMWDRDGNSFEKYVGKLEYFANFRDMVENHFAYPSGITGFRLFHFRVIVEIIFRERRVVKSNPSVLKKNK